MRADRAGAAHGGGPMAPWPAPARPTRAVVLGTILGWLAYDVYAAARWGARGTLSYTIWYWAAEQPLVAFGLGLVVGHLLWPQTRPGGVGPARRAVVMPPGAHAAVGLLRAGAS